MKLAVTHSGAVALQADGTLWKIPNSYDIRQFGTDTDWKEIAAGGGTFMAVKQDGTLWGWGLDANGMFTENWKQSKRGVPVANPVQIGKDSDWVNVFLPDGEHALGVKRDGTTWQWGHLFVNGGEVRPLSQKVRVQLEGSDWLTMISTVNWQATLGIRADGSLWAVGNIPNEITFFGEKTPTGRHPDAVRIGTKSDWIALSGDWQPAALEANGTLCTMQWDQVKRPSKYADWLAATEYGELTWALAKDGTLSCWNEFGFNWPDDKATFMQRFFLGPTRRPRVSYNILSQQ